MAASLSKVLRLGASQVCTTPEQPVQVCPFRSLPQRRGRLMDGVLGDIFCSALYLERGEWNAMLLAVDVLWLPEALCADVGSAIAAKCGVPAERCLIAATHTHSSPQTLGNAPFYGDSDPSYTEYLAERMIQAAVEARDGARQGAYQYREHRLDDIPFAGRNVFVRDRLDGARHCLRAARPGEGADPYARTLLCTGKDGRPLAVVVGLAAHPVFNFMNKISPDYPGELRTLVRDRLGADVPVLFLQGFDGDVRPAYFKAAPLTRLYRLLRFGSAARLFQGDLSGLEGDFASRIAAQLDFKAAPMVLDPAREPFERGVTLAPHGKGGPDDQLRLARLDLPAGPSLVSVNAEVFSSYVPEVRAAGASVGLPVVPVGCAGGMFGYVPDAEMFGHDVGYELESWRNFGRSGPLHAGFAEEFAAALRALFEPQAMREAV